MRIVSGEDRPEYDVIVVGSGAAGLSAAAVAARLGQQVLVLEKATLLGGTSAVSGGMVWIPGTRQARDGGIQDDKRHALEYVRAVARGRGRNDLTETVVANGSTALAFLEDECGLRFTVLEDFPDYRQDLPHAAHGGRTLEPSLYESAELGSLIDEIRSDGRAPFTMQEYERWGAFTKFPWEELEKRQSQGIQAKGRALIASLVASCVRDEVTLAVDVPVQSLTTTDDQVDGVVLTGGSSITARKGVVIATGGFEWDRALADSMVQSRIFAMCSPPTNTGDGLRMAQRIGSMTRGTREAWWAPMAVIGDERDGQPIGTLLRFERQGPGSVMVNGRGRRFANESQNYNDLARALHSWDPANNRALNTPAHLIIDSRYLKKYGLFSHRHGSPTPDYLTSAPSVHELALAIGVPPEDLTATIERFNAHAVTGLDPDFHRGETAYDKYWGDDDNTWQNPSLAPLTEGPFYALKVVNGVFGTNGGIATDEHARVLDCDGEAIGKLFAIGNVTESAYAAGYPGAGATLGPIITLGYLAATAIAAPQPTSMPQ